MSWVCETSSPKKGEPQRRQAAGRPLGVGLGDVRWCICNGRLRSGLAVSWNINRSCIVRRLNLSADGSLYLRYRHLSFSRIHTWLHTCTNKCRQCGTHRKFRKKDTDPLTHRETHSLSQTFTLTLTLPLPLALALALTCLRLRPHSTSISISFSMSYLLSPSSISISMSISICVSISIHISFTFSLTLFSRMNRCTVLSSSKEALQDDGDVNDGFERYRC